MARLPGGTCAGCHGANGIGTPVGADLASGMWLWGDGSLKSITDTIKQRRAAAQAASGARCRLMAKSIYPTASSPRSRPMSGQLGIRRRGSGVSSGQTRKCHAQSSGSLAPPTETPPYLRNLVPLMKTARLWSLPASGPSVDSVFVTTSPDLQDRLKRNVFGFPAKAREQLSADLSFAPATTRVLSLCCVGGGGVWRRAAP